MQSRTARWMVALMIVVGGGVLPAIVILRAPDEEPSTPSDAPVAVATPTRPRLSGITKPSTGSRQAPLQFSAATTQVQTTPASTNVPIPATVDDSRSGVRPASTDALAGPSLGAPRVETSASQNGPAVAPPAPLNTAGAQALTARNAPAAPAPAAQAVPVEVPTGETVAEPISPPVEMTSAMRRAARHNQDGFALAAKGAWYSARAEFHSALELEVAGADSLEGASARSRALREARIALQEASDFAPRSGTGSRRLDVAHLVAGHQSQVIDAESSAGWSAAAAHEAYLAFAKRRFADAGAGRQAASVALHGLGKVHAALGGDDGEHSVDHRKKARAYYEAALEVGPDNFIAANDLAVLLADEGDLERGRATLEAGLRISRQPAMLDNLAGIYRRMGQPQAADQLRAEAAGLKRYAAAGAGDVLPTHDVRFLNPEQFAATARGGDDAGRTPVYSQPAIAQAATAGPYAVQPQAGPQRVVAGPTPGPTPAPAPVRAPVTAGRPIRNALVY